MKKYSGRIIIIVLIIAIIISIGIFWMNGNKSEEKPTKVEATPILELEEFKNLQLDNISEAKVVRYTEGGREEKPASDKEEIKKLFDEVSQLQITEETQQACEDNTTVFQFQMNDNTTILVEIECDWLVLENKRYLIEKKAD